MYAMLTVLKGGGGRKSVYAMLTVLTVEIGRVCMLC